MTAPSVEDVIAAVLRAQGSVHSARREYPDRYRCEHPERYGPCTCAQEIADAVVAAVRAMTVEQQMNLLGDGAGVERGRFARVRDGAAAADRYRVVGPWRAEP